MINQAVRIHKGTTRADPAQIPPAWVTIERDFSSGDYIITAETTAVYYSIGDEPPANFLIEGMILPRDDSLLISMLGGDKFHYYIPAGGTLRSVKVTMIQNKPERIVR